MVCILHISETIRTQAKPTQKKECPPNLIKTAGTDWTLNFGTSGGTDAHHLSPARYWLPFTNTRRSRLASERVALFASFPIENMRSNEALEGTPVTRPCQTLRTHAAMPAPSRRSLMPSSFFKTSLSSVFFISASSPGRHPPHQLVLWYC